MTELKILTHIGHHLNVVNLLGACTKQGGKGGKGGLCYLYKLRGELSTHTDPSPLTLVEMVTQCFGRKSLRFRYLSPDSRSNGTPWSLQTTPGSVTVV